MLFFSPLVLPSCPSPNLSSCLTLLLTRGFGPGKSGAVRRERRPEWRGARGLDNAGVWYFPPEL